MCPPSSEANWTHRDFVAVGNSAAVGTSPSGIHICAGLNGDFHILAFQRLNEGPLETIRYAVDQNRTGVCGYVLKN